MNNSTCVCVCVCVSCIIQIIIHISVLLVSSKFRLDSVCTSVLNFALQTHPTGSHCSPQKSDAGPEARTLADAEIFPRKAESSRRSSVENRERRGMIMCHHHADSRARVFVLRKVAARARRIRVYSSYNLHLSDRRFIPSRRRARKLFPPFPSTIPLSQNGAR